MYTKKPTAPLPQIPIPPIPPVSLGRRGEGAGGEGLAFSRKPSSDCSFSRQPAGAPPSGLLRLSLPPSIQSLISQVQGSEEVQTPCALQGCLCSWLYSQPLWGHDPFGALMKTEATVSGDPGTGESWRKTPAWPLAPPLVCPPGTAKFCSVKWMDIQRQEELVSRAMPLGQACHHRASGHPGRARAQALRWVLLPLYDAHTEWRQPRL